MRSLPAQVNEREVLEALRAEFPGHNFTKIRLLHDGWDNLAAWVDECWIFRFARDLDYRRDQEKRVLEELKGKITAPIPQIEFWGQDLACMGYRGLKGTHIYEGEWKSWSDAQIQALSRELAGFLWECHQSICLEQAQTWKLPQESIAPDFERLENLALIAEPGLADFTRQALKAGKTLALPGPQSFLYNDLHSENFVVDPKTRKLAGVFDFGDCAWGDLHFEFYPLYRYDLRLFEGVVGHYEALSGLKIDKRRSVIYAWFDALADLQETWSNPGHGGHQNAKRWVQRFMEKKDDYL